MKDKRLEETIMLIKKDVQRIEENQYGAITSDVRRTLQQIEENLESKRIDRRTITNVMDRLDGLKYEIRTECQRKNERKYGDVDKTLKDYKREDTPDKEEEGVLQRRTKAKMEESTKSLQNNVSIEYIESRMSSKLSEIRRVLARNGIDENLIDDINLENKSFMRKLLTRIEENVNTSNRGIDESIDMGLKDLFRQAMKQKPEQAKKMESKGIFGFKKNQTEKIQEEQLDAKGIFDTEDLKPWELNVEEKSKFREGEQKVLDNIDKAPENDPERDALDSRDIF